MKIFALTTRGLEALSAAEMREIPGMSVDVITYRRVTADYSGPLINLLALRTVDDVYLSLASWEGVVRQRQALGLLERDSSQLDLAQAVQQLAALHPSAQKSSVFSVTASFVGKRNYTADEIKRSVAGGVMAHNDWQYSENDRPGAWNLRIFLEHDQANVGLRLADFPLHQRSYKQAHLPGSTKPTVAAAMAILGGIRGLKGVMLDPCCGAGTILAEAELLGAPQCLGGDWAAEAVRASQTNLRQAGTSANITRWDARALPLHDQSVQTLLCNLPWGRQVQVDDDLSAHYRALGVEMRRVLSPHGRVVLLTNFPEAVSLPGMACTQHIEISLFGQNPQILVYEDIISSH